MRYISDRVSTGRGGTSKDAATSDESRSVVVEVIPLAGKFVGDDPATEEFSARATGAFFIVSSIPSLLPKQRASGGI